MSIVAMLTVIVQAVDLGLSLHTRSPSPLPHQPQLRQSSPRATPNHLRYPEVLSLPSQGQSFGPSVAQISSPGLPTHAQATALLPICVGVAWGK